jgi:Capsule assembly protein Wzi
MWSIHNPFTAAMERLHGRRMARWVLGIILLFLSAASLTASGNERVKASGPVYVPLDSWIYPALRKLAALGYVPDEEGLAAPWTRAQCLVFVQEAEDIASRHSTKVSKGAMIDEARALIASLKREFTDQTDEHTQARIESVYTRLLGISGQPVRDSYHFGQTIVNDYGRPYEEGTNALAGFSAFGTWGRFSGYFRGEYQEADGRGPYGGAVQKLVSNLDAVPQQTGAIASTNRFDPLEMYVGVQLGDFDITFGKQSLWWGPGEDSAFHFSNNAEPIYMLRIAQQSPFVLSTSRAYPNTIPSRENVGARVSSTSIYQCAEDHFSSDGEPGARFYTQLYIRRSRTSVDRQEHCSKFFQLIKYRRHRLWLA